MSLFSWLEQNLLRPLGALKDVSFTAQVCLCCLFCSAVFSLSLELQVLGEILSSFPFHSYHFSQHTWLLQDQRPLSSSRNFQLPLTLSFQKNVAKALRDKKIKLAVSISLGKLAELLALLSDAAWPTVVLCFGWFLSDQVVAGLGMSSFCSFMSWRAHSNTFASLKLLRLQGKIAP